MLHWFSSAKKNIQHIKSPFHSNFTLVLNFSFLSTSCALTLIMNMENIMNCTKEIEGGLLLLFGWFWLSWFSCYVQIFLAQFISRFRTFHLNSELTYNYILHIENYCFYMELFTVNSNGDHMESLLLNS